MRSRWPCPDRWLPGLTVRHPRAGLQFLRSATPASPKGRPPAAKGPGDAGPVQIFAVASALRKTLIDPVAQYPGQGDALVWLVPEKGILKTEIQVHPCRKAGRKRQVTGPDRSPRCRYDTSFQKTQEFGARPAQMHLDSKPRATLGVISSGMGRIIAPPARARAT